MPRTGATADFGPALAAWFRPLVLGPYNKKAVEDAEANFRKVFQTLENLLLSRTFLASERITIADIAVASCIHRGVETVRASPCSAQTRSLTGAQVLGDSFRSQFPNVFRFFATVTNQVRSVMLSMLSVSSQWSRTASVPEVRRWSAEVRLDRHRTAQGCAEGGKGQSRAQAES